MASANSSRAVRLGPLANRLLGRRRRWLRWAAIALGVLTLLSALSQIGHRPVVHRPAAPAPGPLGGTPVTRVTASPPEMPPGMRVVNLVVPASSASAGRLVPKSRVDVVAAFDTGQERAVRRVLASAIVLRATGASAALSGPEGRFAGPMTELSLAIPASREREIVLAEAFGRLFVLAAPAPRRLGGHDAVEGSCANAGGGCWEPDDDQDALVSAALSVRRYLGLPSGTSQAPNPAPPSFLPSVGAFPAAGFPWLGAGGPSRRPAVPAHGDGSAPRPLARTGAANPDRARGEGAIVEAGRVVEVIEGTSRTLVEVAP